MYSFGKNPPREMESFGVAGLLGEGCQVFYESLFSSRHLGRVSDLLAARLQTAGLDELRLRALLLFSAFEAFRNQHKPAAKPGEPPAAEPLVIECGLDTDKIALGVSFTLPETLKLETGGLAERIGAGNGSGPLETILQQIYASSDRVVLRYQPAIRRVEVVSLLAIPGKMDPAALQARQPLHVVILEKNPTGEPPKVAAYVELGDLDYPQLLRENLPGAELPPPATGEVLVKGFTELEDSLRVRVQGGGTQAQDKIRISGTTQNIQDEVIRIKGGAAGETQDQTVIRIGAGAPASEIEKAYQEKIAALEKRLAELDPDRAAGDEGEGAEEESSQSSAIVEDLNARKEQIKGLFKKVWPFKKKNDDDEAAVADEGGESEAPAPAKDSAPVPAEPAKSEAAPAKAEAVAPAEAPVPAQAASAAAAGSANPEAAANSLMVEIQSGSLDRTINNAQKEANEIKKDLSSAKAKRWVDGLMGELVAEKARLAEFTKKLNVQIRQKELEFRNKEQGLLEELRRRDDLLRQKNSALNRTKEQLSQVQMTLERLKQASHAGSDDAHYKQKYGLTQKMLVTVKDENEKLTEKIEDLKNQLAAAQVNSVKSRGPSAQEFQALQGKYERALKQADEFKRANSELMNKIGESAKKPGATGDTAELKKRLEAAMRLATANQKEAELLQLKVEEAQREEMRLKMELNRANADVKALKQKLQGAKPGSGGVPPKAA